MLLLYIDYSKIQAINEWWFTIKFKIVITIIVKPRTYILYLYDIVLFSIDIVNATVYNRCLQSLVFDPYLCLRYGNNSSSLSWNYNERKTFFLSIPAALLKYYVLIQYSKSYCSQLRPNAGPAVNRPYLFLDSRNSLSLLADHDFCFFGGKNKIPSPQRKHVPSTSCRCCNKKIESAYVFFQKRGRSEKLDSTWNMYVRSYSTYMVNLCFTSRYRWLGCACALIFQCLHMHQYVLF